MNHLISKQIFDVRIASRQAAYSTQQRLSQFFWEDLAPALERLFDQLAPEGNIIRIDRLEIDIGFVPDGVLMSDSIRQRILAKLEDKLRDLIKNQEPGVTRLNNREDQFEQWLHFLEYGYLPWHNSSAKPLIEQQSIFEVPALSATAVRRIKTLLSRSPQALDRLVLQYDGHFLKRLLSICLGIAQGPLTEIAQELYVLTERLPRTSTRRKGKSLSPRQMQSFFWKWCYQKAFIEAHDFSLPDLIANFMDNALKPSDVQAIKQLIATPEGQSKFQYLNNAWPNKGTIAPPVLKKQAEDKDVKVVKEPVNPDTGTPKRKKEQDVTTNEQRKKAGAAEQSDNDIPDPSIKTPGGSQTASKIKHERLEDPAEEDFSSSKKQTDEAEFPKPRTKKEPSTGPDKGAQRRLKGTQELSPPGLTDESDIFTEMPTVKGRTWSFDKAGVVLIQSYFSALFRNLNLIDHDDFIDRAAREKAALLIHYLASGESRAPEYELLLPKILCGIPTNMPLDAEASLNTEEVEEADGLLEAVIEHWEILGETSIDGLREGFLARKGMLARGENGWKLQVERQTIDLLLDRSPLSFGVIKLPWMPEILWVEW